MSARDWGLWKLLLVIVVVNTVVIGAVVAFTPVSLRAGLRGGFIATAVVMAQQIARRVSARRRSESR